MPRWQSPIEQPEPRSDECRSVPGQTSLVPTLCVGMHMEAGDMHSHAERGNEAKALAPVQSTGFGLFRFGTYWFRNRGEEMC